MLRLFDTGRTRPVLLFVTWQVMSAVQRVSLLNMLNDAEQDCNCEVSALERGLEDQEVYL
jgi:hypothetical protein